MLTYASLIASTLSCVCYINIQNGKADDRLKGSPIQLKHNLESEHKCSLSITSRVLQVPAAVPLPLAANLRRAPWIDTSPRTRE